MNILKVSSNLVEIEDDERRRSTVFHGDDGRWKCLRCLRYRCEHAKFVKQQNPTLPAPVVEDIEDLADLIDE